MIRTMDQFCSDIHEAEKFVSKAFQDRLEFYREVERAPGVIVRRSDEVIFRRNPVLKVEALLIADAIKQDKKEKLEVV